MHFSIEEQSFTDTETKVRYTFGVNRQDSALVTITATYEDGHTRVWTYGRNAGLKSEESFPAGVKPTIVVPRENPAPRDPRQLEDEINPPPNADGTPSETDEQRRERIAASKAERRDEDKERSERAAKEAKDKAERDGGGTGGGMLDEGGDGVVPAEPVIPATTHKFDAPVPVGNVNTSESLST